jgi:hypothetical protein
MEAIMSDPSEIVLAGIRRMVEEKVKEYHHNPSKFKLISNEEVASLFRKFFFVSDVIPPTWIPKQSVVFGDFGDVVTHSSDRFGQYCDLTDVKVSGVIWNFQYQNGKRVNHTIFTKMDPNKWVKISFEEVCCL